MLAPPAAAAPSGPWDARTSLWDAFSGAGGAWIGDTFYMAHGSAASWGGPAPYFHAYDHQQNSWSSYYTEGLSNRDVGAAAVGPNMYFVGGTPLGEACTGAYGYCDTVQVVDPSTRAVTLGAPMPTPRSDPAVAAFGGRIYVAGGTGPTCVDSACWGAALTAFEVYDPVADAWQTLPELPMALESPRAVASPTTIHVVGLDAAMSRVHLFSFDPAFSTWTEGPAIEAAILGAGVALCKGSLLVIGGLDIYSGPTDAVFSLDPGASGWTAGPTLPVGRYEHVVASSDDRVIVAGDETQQAVWTLECPPADLPSTPITPAPGWQVVQEPPQPLAFSSAAWAGGTYYVAHGYAVTDFSWTPFRDVAAFTPDQGWTVGAFPPPTSRENAIMLSHEDDLLVVGGYNLGGCASWACADIERFDTETLTWSVEATMPRGVVGGAAAIIDGQIVVVGGFGETEFPTIQIYDLASRSWITRETTVVVPSFPAFTSVGGKLVLVGGWGGPGSEQRVLAYDPSADAWSELPPIPDWLDGASAARCGGDVLVFGGYAPYRGTYSDTTFRLSAATGEWTEAEPMPEPKHWAALGDLSNEAGFMASHGFDPSGYSREAFFFSCGTQLPSPGVKLPPADLVLDDLTIVGDGMAGHRHTASVTVRNAGLGAAGSFRVELRDGFYYQEQSVAALAPGQDVTLSFPLPAPDFHDVLATADVANEVKESNEQNNVANTTFEQNAPPVTCDIPRDAHYVCQGAPFQWYDLGDAAQLPAGDLLAQPLPFPFPYYGVPRHEYYVGSTSFISFQPHATFTSWRTPSSDVPNAAVFAGAWAFLTDARAKTFGEGASQVHVVQLEGWNGDRAQIRLHPTGLIEVAFQQMSVFDGASGIEDDVGNGIRHADGIWSLYETGIEYVPASASPDTADLVVLDVRASPAATEGDTVAVTADVANLGTAVAGPFSVAFLVDDRPAFDVDVVAGLLPGESTTVTSEWPAAVGVHTLHAVADVYDEVTETVHVNNRGSTAVAVAPLPPKPDLVIESFTLTPEDPSPGETVTLRAVVRNVEFGLAGASTLRFAVDGSPIADRTVPPLPPQGTFSVEASWTAAAGVHVLRADADANGEVAETTESNNGRGRVVSVGDLARPDLVVTALRLVEEDPRHGDAVHAFVEVVNAGGTSTPDTILDLLVDEEVVATFTIPALDPGVGFAFEEPLADAGGPGDHVLRAAADADGRVDEADEGNNARDAPYRLRAPDLDILSLEVFPNVPSAGDITTFRANVTNAGDAESPASLVAFQIDSVFLGRIALPALPPGGWAVVESLPWVASSGVHEARAVADPDDASAELDESNNEARRLVAVINKATIRPDLVVADTTWTPADPTSDDDVTFHASVSNVGTVPATSFDVGFRLDARDVGSVRVTALAPGQTVIVSSPAWAATAGTHAIDVHADAKNEIAELDESNNQRASSLRPRAPDLVVSSLAPTIPDPHVGESPSFVATVENRGDHSSASTVLRLVLDGETFADLDVPALAPGASAQVTSPAWPATRGSHILVASADATGVADESDELNDVSTAFFSPHVDLRVTTIRAIPNGQILPNGLAGFEFFARNDGLDPAPATTYKIRLDDGVLRTATLPALAAGASARADTGGYWAISDGAHAIEVALDTGAIVRESDESNVFRGSIMVGGEQPCESQLPDAHGYTCREGPYRFVDIRSTGTPLTLGDEAVSPALDLGFTFPYYGQSVSKVRVGSNGFVTFDNSGAPGCCSGQAIPDATAPNNLVAAYWEDLYPPGGGSITYERTELGGRKVFIVQFEGVPHFCCTRMPSSFETQIFEDGAVRIAYKDARTDGGTHTGGIEGPGGTSGLRYARGSWGAASLGVEYRRTNVGGALADLELTDLVASPASPNVGQSTTFTATVRNSGAAPAEGIVVRLRLEGGATLGDVHLPALMPGESTSVSSAAWSAVGGTHSLLATVDATGSIPESDETDNDLSIPLRVRLPNLRVTSFAMNPASPVHGQLVTFTATIVNDGDGDAGPTTLDVTEGGLFRARATPSAIAAGQSLTVTTTSFVAQHGTRTFVATADASRVVPESDENDNTRSLTVRIRIPDLVVDALTTNPASPAHGDALAYSALVRNAGDADAATFVVRLVQGATTMNATVSGLAAGASANVTFPAFTAVAGNYTATATADATSLVAESSESNNARSISLRVRQANLRVDALTFTPASPRESDAVTFSAALRNTGDAAAGAFVVRFTLDGGLLEDVAVDGLAAGATRTVSPAAWSASGGSFTVAVLADATGAVAEASETDNAAATSFRVREPQLVALSAAVAPEDPVHGTAATLSATFQNAGDADAGAFTVRFLVDGTSVGTTRVEGLAAGATSTATVAWTAAGGDHTLRALVDASNEVREPTETDNEATAAFHVRRAALAATGLASSHASPEHGEAVTLTASVANLGDASTGAFTVRFLVDGAIHADVRVDDLAPGASVDVAAPAWTASGGDRTLVAVVDAADEVDEADESDNDASLPVHVRQADLSAGTLAASPASPAHGEPVVLSLDVRNDGDAGSGPVVVRFLVDGAPVADVSLGALPPGALTTVSTDALTLDGGDRAVRALVDATGAVEEQDEADNEALLALRVRQAELSPAALVASPASPVHGESVVFEATVANAGDGDAGAFTVRFLVDGVALGDVLVGGVPAGASAAVASPAWTATGGGHLVRVVVDALQEVHEPDESNGARDLALHVRQPDLEVVRVTSNPASPAQGQSVTFSLLVRNRGDADAGAFQATLALDGATLVDATVGGLAAGSSVTLTSPAWNATPGAHTVAGVADATATVDESSEANNAGTLAFTTRQPDIVLVDVGIAPAVPLHGKGVTFTAIVRNDGNAIAGRFHVQFVVDGTSELGGAWVESLAPGQSVEVTAERVWAAQRGLHTVQAVADKRNDVGELREDNNAREETFTVL